MPTDPHGKVDELDHSGAGIQQREDAAAAERQARKAQQVSNIPSDPPAGATSDSPEGGGENVEAPPSEDTATENSAEQAPNS